MVTFAGPTPFVAPLVVCLWSAIRSVPECRRLVGLRLGHPIGTAR